MNLCPDSIILLPIFCFFISVTVGTNSPTHFAGGDFSINCGSIGSSPASNGRKWIGDVHPQQLSSLLQIKGSSTTSTVINNLISADPIPHKTSRISNSQFSYDFQLNPGQKIIRLHFNPTPYKGFKGFKDLFTVEAGPFTLLSNFSASLTAHALGVKSFVKEYCLSTQENQLFSIVFSPESSQTYDTYAFINGIEIISVPASLSYFHDGDNGLQVVGEKSMVYIDHNTALEMIHRLNIKQNTIPSVGDFDDMFPMWAMGKENKMKNSTWKVPVDVGFRYLIRLHFLEVGLKIVGISDVMFKILINEMIAHTNVVIVKAKDEVNSIPWYRDYMVMMRGHKREGKRDLLISVKSHDVHGVIAGFEVFKLSNLENSLASPNPLPPPQHSSSHTIQILLVILGHRNAIATVVITIVSLVNILVHVSRDIWEASRTEEENKPSARAERLCRRFTLAEIQLATRNFSDALLIGRGGFGKVYKGLIDKGEKTVAIKRLKSNSRQGSHEFLTEIETLYELRHVNLVSLIGYCNEHGEMILVYDYMANGTLGDHLYKFPRESNNCSSLTWEQCLDICIGAGRGLDYLHTGHGLIHRDVKSSNILLDENFVPKVSDFGLAKPEVKGKLQSHVSTKVKGTYGYLDPYYFSNGKLSRKSDTYAFGVVLLEVLCGRPAVDSDVANDERILPMWARYKISKGEVDQIVALSLKEEISPDSLKTFVGVAERCLDTEPKNRPTMSQVVLLLELALEQQQNKQLLAIPEITSASADIHPCNDEIDDQSGQPTKASTDVPEVATPSEEQMNSKVVNTELPSGTKRGRRGIMNKPSRLRPWDVFWNKVKPFKKNDFLLSDIWEDIRDEDITLAKFDWDTIAAATNQFSNKVGQGGFGVVYKALLPTGQMVAVKRLSGSSRQYLKELRNEIILLPKLQHENIIKLLGYCFRREEKLLVYEFMQNRSLDTFIYIDEAKCLDIRWSVRFKILMGISRGVLYLHQDSGLRVIHKDLKLSNILLDVEMNPKISDFSLARTLVEHQSESETSQIVGTYNYMSPEYFEGKFSVKSDIYSFGIIVLEMVSGITAINAPYLEPTTTLVDFAWKLWNEGKALNVVDISLQGQFSADEAMRCIQVGLLCTQWDPNYRPTMPSVLKILQGEEPEEELQIEPSRARKYLASPSLHSGDGRESNATFEFDDTLERY